MSPAAAPLFQLTGASARLLISGSSGRRDGGRAGRKASPVASSHRALPRRVLPGTPHPRREMALFKGLPGRSPPPPPPFSCQPLFPLFLCAVGKRLRAAFRLNRQASLGRKSWKLLQASHFLSSALPAPINSKKAFVFLFAPINYSRDWHREGRRGEERLTNRRRGEGRKQTPVPFLYNQCNKRAVAGRSGSSLVGVGVIWDSPAHPQTHSSAWLKGCVQVVW